MSNSPLTKLSDGNAIPQVGLGVWQTPNDVAVEAVRTALEAGYRHVDTAAIYGNEEGVGQGLRAADVPRGEIFVTTKVWNEEQGYDEALRAAKASLKRLGLEQVDLLLIHWPSPWRGKYLETWKALVQAQKDGLTRSIGVSNFEPEHLERIVGETGVAPVLNQIELHPRFQQKATRAANAAQGVKTESWSPLGQGRLLNDPVIANIARKHGKTPAQVIICWHVDNDLIVIPKSVTPSRIRENFEVFDFQLDADDLSTVAALDDPEGRIGSHPLHAKF
jgi:2,5-diketo-D-gluconate reductase A